jgi:hypothetical protein
MSFWFKGLVPRLANSYAKCSSDPHFSFLGSLRGNHKCRTDTRVLTLLHTTAGIAMPRSLSQLIAIVLTTATTLFFALFSSICFVQYRQLIISCSKLWHSAQVYPHCYLVVVQQTGVKISPESLASSLNSQGPSKM